MADETWTVRIDGASRGNPGAAAYAVVIERPGQEPVEESDRMGSTTNNIAEYTALVKGLELATRLGGRLLDVVSDSELLVKQMNGEYRVKNEDLKQLYAQAQAGLKKFEQVNIRHVRREQNKRADKLCNEALDGQPRAPIEAAPLAEATSPLDLRERVVSRLQSAAREWARGDAQFPNPAAVWDELWAEVTAGVTRPVKES